MPEFMESLPFPVVAAMLAGVSVAISVAFARIRSRTVAWAAALLTPLLLYWSPVWFRADPAEYDTWSFVFIVPWFLAGAVASCLSLAVARRRLRAHA